MPHKPWWKRGEYDGFDAGPRSGRKCSTPGCITRLNRYNPGPLCLMHASRVQPEVEAEAERLRQGRQSRSGVQVDLNAMWNATFDMTNGSVNAATALPPDSLLFKTSTGMELASVS